MTARRFRVQSTDVIGVLLGLLVLGLIFAPKVTAWLLAFVVAVWAVCGVVVIVGGLLTVWLYDRNPEEPREPSPYDWPDDLSDGDYADEWDRFVRGCGGQR